MQNYNNSPKKIRLVYAQFEKFTHFADGSQKIGQQCFWSKQFQLPERMSLSDACKVISFLSEKIEKENSFEAGSLKSVMKVSSILENHGFKVVEGTTGNNIHGHGPYLFESSRPIKCFCKKEDDVLDFITYGGQEKEFERSDLCARYFEWFSEGIKEDEIKNIYDKLKAKHKNDKTVNL